jgi:hypothetical protein
VCNFQAARVEFISQLTIIRKPRHTTEGGFQRKRERERERERVVQDKVEW